MANITTYTDSDGIEFLYEDDILWAVDSGTGWHVCNGAPFGILNHLEAQPSEGVPYYPWREILPVDRWMTVVAELRV